MNESACKPAFPGSTVRMDESIHGKLRKVELHSGMTFREYAAVQIAAGIADAGYKATALNQDIALTAVALADELIAQLEKGK